MEGSILLISIDEYQPLSLLQQHIRWHEAANVHHYIIFSKNEPCLEAKIEWCTQAGLEHCVCDIAELNIDHISSDEEWFAVLRIEEFLISDPLPELVKLAEAEQASVVECAFFDRLSVNGSPPPISQSLWDDFPVKACLSASCGFPHRRPFLVAMSTEDVRTASNILQKVPEVHVFRWHGTSTAIFARLTEKYHASAEYSLWLRASQYSNLSRIDLRSHTLSGNDLASRWFLEDIRKRLSTHAKFLEIDGSNNPLLAKVGFCSDTRANFLALESDPELDFIFNSGAAADASTRDSSASSEGSFKAILVDLERCSDAGSLGRLVHMLSPGGMLAGAKPLGENTRELLSRWISSSTFELDETVPGCWTAFRAEERSPFRRVYHRRLSPQVPARCAFNPTIQIDPVSGRWLVSFRTVQEEWNGGEIWCAEINPDTLDLNTEPSRLQLGGPEFWYEDPRLFAWKGTLWVSYARTLLQEKITNRQGIAQLQRHNGEWRVSNEPMIFESPDGRRQEKNWSFFDHHGELHAIYGSEPWTILRLDPSNPSRSEVAVKGSSLWWAYGEIRGGSAPIRAPNGNLWALYHSSTDWQNGVRWRYFCGLVELDAHSLLPVRQTHVPLLFETPAVSGWMGYHTIWPAGLFLNGAEVIISYGRNNEEIHLKRISVDEIDALLQPPLLR